MSVRFVRRLPLFGGALLRPSRIRIGAHDDEHGRSGLAPLELIFLVDPPALLSCPWERFTPGTVRFCEERLCGWVAEPANAWSNLAFVAMGVYLLRRARIDGRTPLSLVGVTSILVGLGSFLFHMSGTFVGEFADLSAMFLIGALMVTMEARRFVAMNRRQVTTTFFALSIGAMLLLAVFRKIGIALFGVQVALVYASNIFWKMRGQAVSHRYAWRLGGTFALALGIWVLDLTGVVCAPQNHVFTGHSLWHVLTAVCLYFFYRHQEQFVEPGPARTSLIVS
jgi:hypothetical protein